MILLKKGFPSTSTELVLQLFNQVLEYVLTASIYCRYNGVEGLHIKVTEFVKDKDCLVCGPGVLLELDTSVTLQKVYFLSPSIYFLPIIISNHESFCASISSSDLALGN